MYELLMQIDIFEKESNRRVSFDDIVKMRIKKNILYLQDDLNWKTNLTINNDTEIKIYFDTTIPF